MAAGTKGIRAGKAYVELFADNSKLVGGLRVAEKKLKAFGERVGQLGQKLLKVSSLVAVPIAAGAKVFADFERQMANVSTMLDKPQAHMDNFRKAIRQMAVQFGESTETLAGGLYDILSASIAPAKALDVLAVAVKAAKGGMTDTKTAADAITTVLNTYSLSADRAADVSDLLFSIVKRGKTTFAQLAPSIGNVATIAASAGVSFEELGAALAVMTRSGIQTDNAITALNAIISSFLKPTAEGVTYARQLGFELSSTTIQAEGLAGVFRRIADLPPDAISRLFPNIRALKGVLPALKNLAGFTEDMEVMAKRSGAATAAYKKMSGTLDESFKRIKQTGLLVLSVIGESLAEPIKKASQRIVKLGRAIADLLSKNRDLVVTIAKVAAIVAMAGVAFVTLGLTIKTLAVAFGGVAAVVGVFGKAFHLVATVVSLVLSPVGLVIAAITALGGILLVVSGAGSAAIDWLKDKFQTLKKETTEALGGIADALAPGDIALAAKILWLTLKMEWQRGVNTLKKAWLDFRNFFIRIGYDAFYGMLALAETVWHGLETGWIETTAFFSKTWNGFVGFFARTWESIKAGAQKAWNWIKSLFDESIDLMAENKLVEEQKQKAITRIEDQQQRQLAQREAERQRQREQATATHDATLAEVGRQHEQKYQALDAEYDAKMAENQQELARARKEWKEAIVAAREKRKVKEAAGPDKLTDPESIIAKAQAALSGMGDLLTRKAAAVNVTGTFNAMGTYGLGVGGVAERTASACEQTAGNTGKLLDKAQEGGLTFS